MQQGSPGGVHLWVLDQNSAAQAFYEVDWAFGWRHAARSIPRRWSSARSPRLVVGPLSPRHAGFAEHTDPPSFTAPQRWTGPPERFDRGGFDGSNRLERVLRGICGHHHYKSPAPEHAGSRQWDCSSPARDLAVARRTRQRRAPASGRVGTGSGPLYRRAGKAARRRKPLSFKRPGISIVNASRPHSRGVGRQIHVLLSLCTFLPPPCIP